MIIIIVHPTHPPFFMATHDQHCHTPSPTSQRRIGANGTNPAGPRIQLPAMARTRWFPSLGSSKGGLGILGWNLSGIDGSDDWWGLVTSSTKNLVETGNDEPVEFEAQFLEKPTVGSLREWNEWDRNTTIHQKSWGFPLPANSPTLIHLRICMGNHATHPSLLVDSLIIFDHGKAVGIWDSQ